ncbi:VOC family protein [Persicitalea jodogahamensis]|nr:VOC family protein [Persicitalea jodogahamensis]
MTKIIPYLTFNGNCREAMNFYRECVGGKLDLTTVGESPMAEQMPEAMKESILHARLRKDELVLLGSDMVSEKGLNRGNCLSIMLEFETEAKMRRCYDKLAEGGQHEYPIENTFWAGLFGSLTDRYGNHWLLHYGKDAQ